MIDEPRSTKPWRVLCDVWATVLAVLAQHWLSITGCWQYPERSLVKAAQVVRLHAMHLLATLHTGPRLEEATAALHRCLPAACRLNQRTQHPNTHQLLLHPDLVAVDPAAA